VVRGEPLEYDGEVFDLSGFRLRCDPPETPPPVDAATIGPKAVELTGRFADGWQAVAHTPEGFKRRLDHLRRGVDLGGRSIEDVRVMLTKTCCVLKDAGRARDLAAQHVAFYVGGMGEYYRDALARAGYDRLARSIYDSWGADDRERAVELVKEELLEYAVVGAPETAHDRFETLRSRDAVDAFCVVFPRGASRSDIRETTENIAAYID